MDTIVLKFGGSSVADNEKLKIVANKIIPLYDKGHRIVVILSAQGKTTDKLISEAFNVNGAQGVFAPGVVSRKKQLVPNLTAAVRNM